MEYKKVVITSPSVTPRSSERTKNGDANGTSRHDKDKGVNVQVLVRCRPFNEDELKANVPLVINCHEQRREVSVYQSTASKNIDRTFTFDKVFGPNSQQKELYDQAIVPIVNEVLDGYNCTIFAYGQTGTGKTYTMEGGGRKAKNGEFPPDAGVIPRAVRQIFDTLEAQNAEYSMKVTCLELYNEEITDLLAPDEFSRSLEDKSKKPIALMEDGKGGVFVRGLEEEIVCSANEIYTLLERGSSKRRTAETLLNKQSSRSHCIFSITIHIKEVTPEGEELIKCGKLNLVDLAGSENISRSGAREGRAREAGEINKSLLTLGRVITALVEHLGHIPYRDSKLTRLLRDSLGGKTKTCIIATVSPSVYCLEETLSTLDYAHRAKSIKNKPEVNQKMMKSALIKDLYSEIDRLKQEVHAAREKNGIYLPRERFVQDEAEKKAMTEKIEHQEIEMEAKDKQIEELQGLYNSQKLQSADFCIKLEITEKKLEDTEYALNDVEEKNRQLNSMLKEKEFIISNLLQSEKAIVEQACGIRSELENAAQDVSGLFAKIERKDKIETGNKVLVQTFRAQLTQELEVLHKTVEVSATQQQQHLTTMEKHMQSFVSTKTDATEELRNRIEKLKTIYDLGMKGLHDLANALDDSSLSTFGKLNTTVSMHASTLENVLGKAVLDAEALLSELHSALSKQESGMTSYAQQQRKALLRTIESTRVISKINTDFFATLERHASKLNRFVEDMQRVHDKKLEDLEKKYQECAVYEEKQLLDKFAEMLASSTARKSQLVQSAVHDLRENAVNNTHELQEGMSNMQNDTSGVQNEWNIYMKQAEHYYVEDTTSVTMGHSSMEETVHECMAKTTAAGGQWKSAQDSVQKLEKSNIEAVNSIIKSGTEANQLILTKFTHSLSSTNEEFKTGNDNFVSSIDSLLKLDHEICTNIQSTLAPCSNEFIELQKTHYGEVEEISRQAHEYLEEEYMEDQSSCTTPRRRPINIPSMASIEELQTPSFDELLHEFRNMRSENRLKQANGELKHLMMSDFSSMRESRIPLTAIN
ncbi:hypothetical protein KI387_006735 [Taxus chinensis]|uniref:Kinesin motor domain-containing protein n=1 Tax=Taxus chinensis TaxID=29808 RepID=A0AA38LMB2_TAXCH|nr:hypothetical protein KI387_006735 [Taxus chinensis]